MASLYLVSFGGEPHAALSKLLCNKLLDHTPGMQDTATTCRERCGGQGYLSCNRFGQILGFAHAGMTAEGDNRVLMMKVSKEYLATTHLASTRARLQAGASHATITGEASSLDCEYQTLESSPVACGQSSGASDASAWASGLHLQLVSLRKQIPEACCPQAHADKSLWYLILMMGQQAISLGRCINAFMDS